MKRFVISMAMLLLVGAGCAAPNPATPTAPSGEMPGTAGNGSTAPNGTDLTYSGKVVSVNLDQIAADGPAVVTLQTSTGVSVQIHVPSFGINLCKARTSIADVSTLKVGDAVEVHGAAGADGAIVPCDSEAHYLRVVKK